MLVVTWMVIGVTCGVLTNRARPNDTNVFADMFLAVAGAVIGGVTATSMGLVRPPGLHLGAVLAAAVTAMVALLTEEAVARFLQRRR